MAIFVSIPAPKMLYILGQEYPKIDSQCVRDKPLRHIIIHPGVHIDVIVVLFYLNFLGLNCCDYHEVTLSCDSVVNEIKLL